jgi:hypothetical protein
MLQGGELKCLVVGRKEKTTFQSNVGYAHFPGLDATTITFVHGGIIGELDAEGAKHIAAEFGHLLRRGEADIVTVNFLSEHAALWTALKGVRLRTTQHLVWATHRSLALPPNRGFLLQQMRSKHRSSIKRKQKDLEDAFPDKIRWTWHSKVDDVTSLCEKMEEVSRTTYHRGLGAGFVDNEESRARLALFARQGQLRVLLLEVAGVPQAFWFGQVYGGAFHSAATGYKEMVRRFEVGTHLFLRMVDLLIDEGVGQLDFGLGDAQYKERFGDHAWREASSRIYAPTFKGALLWLLQGVFESIERLARASAHHFGNTDRIKRLWRMRLQAKASQEQPNPRG